jgi:hypothetical protein
MNSGLSALRDHAPSPAATSPDHGWTSSLGFGFVHGQPDGSAVTIRRKLNW